MLSSRPTSATAAGPNGTNGVRPKPTLEIIPESRFIVFHGDEHEAPSVKLRGVVRLTTPESMSICRPRVRLEGKRKIAWWYTTGLGAAELADKRVFWNEEQKVGVESAHKIKAGVMEWPFEFDLAAAMPESVEGLRETYIAYHLHATVSRPGWNARGLHAQEHIRLVRTLGSDSMDTTRSRVNADIWANKISYSISIPSDAVVFGTSITADVELSPIRKGLRMGRVELRLIELTVKRIQASELGDGRGDRVKSDEVEVAKEDMDFPEHSKVMYDEETADSPVLADEMYKFKATLPLPKSLNLCRQDVDSHQISISHRFKLLVNIHNPEGHISQLVCKLPIKLFISPNLPIDESNTVQSVSGLADEALNNTEPSISAPPQYGQHQLDQIFSDVDTAGYLSLPGTGPVTPAGWNARSRRASQENVTSLNGVMDHNNNDPSTAPSPSLSGHGSATPSDLRSRLTALQGTSAQGAPSAHPDHNASEGSSNTALAAPSNSNFSTDQTANPSTPNGNLSAGQSAPRTPNGATSTGQTTAYDMNGLARVPSYGAALRTSGSVTPHDKGPPTYDQATSRPASPGAGPAESASASSSSAAASASASSSGSSSLTGVVQEPPQAHTAPTAAITPFDGIQEGPPITQVQTPIQRARVQ